MKFGEKLLSFFSNLHQEVQTNLKKFHIYHLLFQVNYKMFLTFVCFAIKLTSLRDFFAVFERQ